MPTLTQARALVLYGDPGLHRSEPDPAWVKANIVTSQGANAMPGVPRKWYFQCHRLVEDQLRRAFAAARTAAPGYHIERAASFVFRHMRHDNSLPLSLHSWGVAVDIDAADNAAHTFTPGTCPEPWSPAWMKLWPHGLPRAFVEAFEAQGFEWGGRWTGYCDPMHFQVKG